jgi:uncharacterized protein (TIGR02246 family)
MVQQASGARAGIDRVNQQFMDAFNRGDLAAVAAVYTETATVLPPGGARVQGRDGIRQFWQGVRDSGLRGVALQTDDLAVAGEMAREIGTATLTFRPEGAADETTTIVKYVVVWERQGGAWRWETDIWNTDQ